MLSGLRVLDLTDERGQLAGRVLADLGAEVILVEPPRGVEVRHRGAGTVDRPSLRYSVLNAGKRSIAIDWHAAAGRAELDALVQSADVVIDTCAPAERVALRLRTRDLEGVLPDHHPGLVHCAISPFGQTGPRADWQAHDLVTVAMGGNMAMTGDPARPPVRCSLPTSAFHGGPEAAVAILAALHARPRIGRGQFIDCALQETQLLTLLSGPAQYASTGQLGRRSGARTGRTREIWRCADGWISYGLRGGPARIPNLIATVEYMAESDLAPDWLREMDWSTYSPLTLTEDELERLEAAFAAFFATKTMRELYETALERRILLAPCNDAREILAQPQLRSRDFFTKLEEPGRTFEVPAFFARASQSEIGVRGPAPTLDADGPDLRGELEASPHVAREPFARATAPYALECGEAGVFAGLKVLELGAGAAGPVATGYLAEQGAHVIRIESSKRPDFLRVLHVTAKNRDEPGIYDRAPMFVLLNPDKQSLTLDMKSPEAVAIVERLVTEWADVVAENFAPGVMERFGLGWDRIHELDPSVIMVRGCLFGQTGPQRSYPGFGGQGAAIAGFNHLTGWRDAEALGPYATITDSLSPRFVAATLLAAMFERERTGEGQCVDVSQIETGVYCLSEAIARHSATGETLERMGNASEVAAPHGVFACRPDADDDRERWIAIAVRDDVAWQALVDVLGRPAWAARPEYTTAEGRLDAATEIERELEAWTREREVFELAATLQAAGVEAGPVQDFKDLVDDPQLAHRGHFVELDHAALGRLEFERRGYRLSETPGGVHAPGPLLGEHTRGVLRDVLGMSEQEIDRLQAEGVTA